MPGEMTLRIQCDGCGEFLASEDFVGIKGQMSVNAKGILANGGGFHGYMEFANFHWCHACQKIAIEALKKANEK